MSLNGGNSGSRSLDYDLEQTRPASNSTLTITNGDDGGSLPPNSTVIKYEKSSCLFCNEWFDSQTFTEHLIHCGQVLEQCPNSCNVFVPRIRMRSHLKECPRTKQQRLSATSLERLERLDQQVEHRVQVLEQDTGTLRSVLNEEIRQRLHLITDVGNLRKLNQVQDDRTQRTEEMINTLRKCIEEESGQRCYEIEQCQKDFRYCYDLTQSMKAELQHDVEEMREHVNKVSLQVTEHQNHLNDNIIKLEELMLEQEKINRDKFVECEDYLSTISGDLKTKFVTNADLSSKIANLDLEVKSMKNIVCDTEERCEKLEAIVEQMDRSLHHTMQSLADLEHHMATHQRLASVQNTRGHLIWRIKDYSKKLEEAKQYDTILHSAMFSNKPFGYNLRLDIYLNGKGTWRGRNIIACLNVLAGEYDPLLAWPCRCQAEISIREQGVNPDNAQDYVKVVPVRKKSDEQLQANSFFYIPHKVIASNNYLKNDSFFIEVRMLK